MRRILALIFAVVAYITIGATKAEATIAATGQQCNARSSSAASVSCTVSVTSGNTVVLIGIPYTIARLGAFTNAGCSDNKSNTYKLGALTASKSASVTGLKICYAAVTTTASTTFTWTNQGGNDFCAIVVVEFSGVLTATDPLDQSWGSSGSSANGSTGTSFATTTAGQVSVVGLQVNAAGTLTCDAAYTQIAEDESFTDVSYNTCYKILSSTGTQSATWTSPNQSWATAALTLSETAPGLTGTGVFVTGHQCAYTGPTATATSQTCVMPTVTNDFIILMGFSSQQHISGSAADCSDSAGNSYSYATSVTRAGAAVEMCYAKASTTGSVSVKFTATSADQLAIHVVEVAGLLSSGTLDKTATNSGSSANGSTGTTAATTTANEFLVSNLAVGVAGTLTCGAGWTQIAEDEAGPAVSVSSCYKIVAATGTQSMTWTSPNNSWAAEIATFAGPSGSNLFSPDGVLFLPH